MGGRCTGTTMSSCRRAEEGEAAGARDAAGEGAGEDDDDATARGER